jgi:hypothetical protein
MAGLRARYPKLSKEMLHRRFLRTVLGESLYLKLGLDEGES